MTKSTMTCLGLAAGLAMCAAIGCAQTTPTIRGQSPAVQPVADMVVRPAPPAAPMLDGPLIGTAPGYGERPKLKHSKRDFKMFAGYINPAYGGVNGFYDADVYAQPQRVYEVGGHGPGCPACNGGLNCPDGGCPHCGCGCDHGCPDHYYTYGYKWPKNLVYPPPVLPAGMVQYPYYTLRGPTDFFMK